MLVSTFELLVKRIAPLIPPGITNPANAPFRRVVQGYFLIITNLNPNRTANFSLRFTIPSVSPFGPPDFDREIDVSGNPNVRTGYDVAAFNNVPLALGPAGTTADVKRFRTARFSAGPLQTVSVNLLPNLGNPAVLTNENLEVRGSVELFQAYGSIQDIFNGVPATDVLLSAEIRGTFLDNDYPNNMVGTELDFDQINYGLPLASGNGRNTVESLSGIRVPIFDSALTLEPELLKEVQKDLITGLNEELAPLRLTVQPLAQDAPVG
jgi:hypothetical protein